MTAKELILSQSENAAYQLTKVLEGWPVPAFEHKLTQTYMSAREQVTHLSECYVALAEELAGNKYEWGSWTSAVDGAEAEVTQMWDLRNKAFAIATTKDSHEAVQLISNFMVEHDCYHVGQLSILRITVDPDWDAYSIYRM